MKYIFFNLLDPHVDHAVQQTGFLRVKRGYGMPKAGLDSDDLALTASKKSPWVSLREALDGGLQVKWLFKKPKKKPKTGQHSLWTTQNKL